ncbi:TPA: type II toxin-antitoxin system Phd/YefM family antitoxin, partial [Streptococcus pneumoniae]
MYNSGKELKRGMVMEAVLYSTFRNHLKDYMK